VVPLTDTLALREGPAQGVYTRVAVRDDGAFAIAWHEAGTQFGTDLVQLRVFEDGLVTAVDTSVLADPEFSQFTPAGIAIGFAADGELIVAVNRAVSNLGVGQYRTVVGAWDGVTWARLGQFVGASQTAGPFYVLDGEPGITLAYLEVAGRRQVLKVEAWDGQNWTPLSDGPLNVDVTTTADLLSAAVVDGLPVVLRRETVQGESFALLDLWFDGVWEPLPDLPNQGDIAIGDVAPVALEAAPDGTLFAATAEQGRQTSYVEVWMLGLDDGRWRIFDPPVQAADSECAQQYAIAVDDDLLYYAWTADCVGQLFVMATDGDVWFEVAAIRMGRAVQGDPPIAMAVTPDGEVIVVWLEEGANAANRLVNAALLVP
jgi:hypothetical protein